MTLLLNRPFFGDGLRDLCFDEDKKRLGESGFGAGEPWPGAQPVCPRIGPSPEEERAVQRVEPDGTPELAAVAVRGAEPSGLRWSQARLQEEDFLWQPAEVWVKPVWTSTKNVRVSIRFSAAPEYPN